MYFADEVPDLSVEGVEISPEAIANAIYDIYYDEIDADSELQAELFEQTRRIFADAVAEGVVNAAGEGVSMPDDEFLRAMGDNIEVFSAFRVHRMQKDMVAQMTDGSGRLKPFSKFLNDAFNYADHKNKAWLRTEYNTAVVRAHNAAEWRQFEAEKDVYPNLEWIASTSPNPGRDHSAFWGVVRPVDDPFWNEHRPGDRWNCKCELRATNKRATKVPGRAGKDNDPAPGLEKNPGKKGEVFSDKHPYYPQSCSKCPYSGGGLSALWANLSKRKKDCDNCNKVHKKINQSTIDKASKAFEAYNPNEFEKTFFCESNGGFLVTSIQRIIASKRNKQERAKYEKERDMCLVFAKAGNQIEHLAESSGKSSSDVIFNGVFADLKRTESCDQIVKYGKYAIRKQGAKLVLFQFDNWNAKMASAVKELAGLKIHGKYFITGRENEIFDF